MTALRLANPSLLVIGLQNGTFQGWNLQADQVDTLQAHQSAVHSLFLYENMLISGAVNEIQVWDNTSFNRLLQGAAKHNKGAPAEIRSLALMKAPSLPNPIVVAGDSLGFITLLTTNAMN